MTRFLKVMAAAAVMSGAALFASAPARAGGVSIAIGVPGIAFSYDSGGYCDRWGCPDAYWDLPVYYGPVYFGGEWYQGPVYYRRVHGHYWYWIHGGWHRDEWRGPRPHWYRQHRHTYRYGPALGYDYYRGHGFRHERDRHWRRHERRHDVREERRDRRHDRRHERHEDHHDHHDHDGHH